MNSLRSNIEATEKLKHENLVICLIPVNIKYGD